MRFDDELREEALSQARLSFDGMYPSTREILERAQEFYEFLAGLEE